MNQNPQPVNILGWILGIAFALIILLAVTSSAFAASIKVYPTITNAHGGTKSAADIRVCWEVDGLRSCDVGVPTFEAPAGSTYRVFTSPPRGYSAALRGACEGTAGSDSAICYADYQDGAPIVEDTTVVPPALTAPAAGTPGGSDSHTTTPQPAPTGGSGLTMEQIAAIIGLLEAFGVDPAIVGTVAVILYGN